MFRILALAPLMAVLALGNAYAGGEKKDDEKKEDDKPQKKKDFKFDAREIFNKLDANKDGKVSKEEFMAGKGPKDKDKDDDDAEKRKAFQEKMFANLDDDSDGFVSGAEWKKGWEEMREKFGRKKKDRPDDDDDKKEKKDVD